MNNSKKDRRLRSLWYKKDIKGWIDFKLKIGRYSNKLTPESDVFKEQMEIWNQQFEHKDRQHYKDWDPYCCSDRPCSSSALERMRKTEHGWKCPHCKIYIGKHLYRISDNPKKILLEGWDNYNGLPHIRIRWS